MWQKLQDCPDPALARGSLFRFPARPPFEPRVDFLLVDATALGSGFVLVCASGYKAGLVQVVLPPAALVTDPVVGISTPWLIENWQTWVCPECAVTQVWWTPQPLIPDVQPP